MKEHIQVKKPYTYSYCDKKFAENQNMKMHERINISKKEPFEYIVTKHVHKKDIIKKHERILTGKKLYVCIF